MTFEETFSAGFTETRVVSGGCAPILPSLPPTEGHLGARSTPPPAEAGTGAADGAGEGPAPPGPPGRVEGQCLGSSEGSSLCQSHHPNRPDPLVLETQHQMHTNRNTVLKDT